MQEIRLLTKDDIEVRVAQATERGNVVKATLLLYKNARVDMKIMDELYGPFGWKRSHKLLGDRLYCIVEVWDNDKKEWVAKEDVGVESNTEAEKGQASDSFKRACVNWGIGRELYTAPRIVVELGNNEYTKRQNGTIQVWATFSVDAITYNEKERSIKSLRLVDKSNVVRYEMTSTGKESKPAPKKETKKNEKAEPAPTPTPQKVQLTKEQQHAKWVVAIATGWVSKMGVPAMEAWKANCHPSEDEIAAMQDEVFNYRIDNGIKANQPVNL